LLGAVTTFIKNNMTATPDSEFPCSITLNVPFPTTRLATTALKAIQVDPELSPLVRRQLTVVPAPTSKSTQGSPNGQDAGVDADAQLLEVQYKATTNRMLRVAVNGFMESLKLVVEVMEQLDTDVLAQQQQ
jgi:EKC/KEOPS complex subunit PCC1/LAGE3